MSEYRNGKVSTAGYDDGQLSPGGSKENGTCIVDMCFEDAMAALYGNSRKREWHREHKRALRANKKESNKDK